MNKKFLAISLVLSLMLVSVFSFAFEGEKKGSNPRPSIGEGSFQMHPMLLEKAGVSSEKINQIKAIMNSSREGNSKYFDEMRKIQTQITDEFKKANFSESKIRSLSAQLAKIKQIQGRNQLETLLKVMKVLSKDERVKLFELAKQRPPRRRGGMEPR